MVSHEDKFWHRQKPTRKGKEKKRRKRKLYLNTVTLLKIIIHCTFVLPKRSPLKSVLCGRTLFEVHVSLICSEVKRNNMRYHFGVQRFYLPSYFVPQITSSSRGLVPTAWRTWWFLTVLSSPPICGKGRVVASGTYSRRPCPVSF